MVLLNLKILNVKLKTSKVEKLSILDEDTIREVKDKIYILTGIPSYRQYLAYQTQDGSVKTLGYTILKFNYLVNTDIFLLEDNNNIFEGLPIDISLFESKDHLRVLSLNDSQIVPPSAKTLFLMDIDNFIAPIKSNIESLLNDTYSLELIYYSFILKYWPQLTLSVFASYITDEESLVINYPYLTIDPSALKEMYNNQNKLLKKQKDININMIITNIKMTIKDKYILPKTYVQVRNIFDLIELNNTITYSMLHLAENFNSINLLKTWKTVSNKNDNKLPKNSVLLNIRIDDINSISLIIRQNGDYYVIVDRGIDLSSIKKIVIQYVNPILTKINSLGFSVSNNPFYMMDMSNSYFCSMNISITHSLTTSDDGVENTIDKFEEYGLMSVSSNNKIYFTKGVYTNPTIEHSNQFVYMSDPEIYEHYIRTVRAKKRIAIINRFSDIKIDLFNIKEAEFPYVIKYIKLFIFNLPKSKISQTGSNLKKLKQQDPVLFDFKNVFKSESENIKKYSILCQKQKQPAIFTERPDKNAIEYKNITLDKPVYYKCLNKKYKFFNFIINKHPKGYCIPCCYKSHFTQGKKKKKIFDNCMKYGQFSTKQLRKQSYIKEYSTSLRPGRIMKLPSILHKVMNESTGILNYNFYIYGIQQYLLKVNDIGVVFCLSNILNTNILDFIDRTIKKIKSSGVWHVLLNGSINNYFSTEKELISHIRNTFIEGVESGFILNNELFISIAELIWDMNIILVEIFDVKNIKISYNKHNLKNKRNVILCKYKNVYNTIYYLNKKEYLINEKIHNVMYTSSNKLIESLYKRVKINDTITSIISSAKYSIDKLYINSKNLCYAVKLNNVYIPIKETAYSNLSYPLSFDTVTEDELGDNSFVLEIIKLLEHTIKFRLKYQGKLVGCIADGLYYLFNPVDKIEVDAPDIELKYNPIDVIKTVNDFTFGKINQVQDNRIKNIDRDMYNKFSYQLFLISFIDSISGRRNTALRNKLHDTKDYKKIRQLLKKYPEDYNAIVSVDKKKMKDFIQNSIFKFDNSYVYKLKQMSISDLKNEISNILKDKIKSGFPKYYKFYNTYNTCNKMDTETSYCDGNKLLLPPGKKELYIDQLSKDIKNPLKSEIILNPIFIQYSVNLLRFVKRPNETIHLLNIS